jgi:hypothetical protein
MTSFLHRKKNIPHSAIKNKKSKQKINISRFTMDPSEESPSSLWMVRAAELFPKSSLEKEDDELIVPFSECNFFIFFFVKRCTIFTKNFFACTLFLF